MSEIAQERWARLRDSQPPHEDIYEQAVEDLDAALIGVSNDGRLHLLLELEAVPQNLPPDLQSIQVRILESGQIWLDVSAQSHHEELLTLIANKVLYAIQIEGRDPAVSVDRIIDGMRAAMRPLAPDLGATEQIGLFGELWVLSNVLFPTIGPRVCHLWSGPESERHDFAGQGVHVEVKTTTRSEPKHEISRLDQLKAPVDKRLLLVSVMLEKSLGGDTTLAECIDEIRGKLGADGHALDVFDSRLALLGWHEGLRQTGTLLRFNFRDVHVFEVVGAFPRLPDDYVPPLGVTNIKYSINVSNLPSLDVTDVQHILKFF
jgi:hypothetical protein